MPEDLLNRIRAELAERVEAGRAARDEYARLERAKAALDAADDSAGPKPAPKRRPRATAPRSRTRPRAPRGQNRERVLAAVRERPGASAAEIASASGVERGALYALLTKLVGTNELTKEHLPDGRAGYALAPPPGLEQSQALDEPGEAADPRP